MPPSEKRRRNVLAIIEMFAGLGLPVCDDEKVIAEKRDEQRSARNRELNSTKGTVAAKAQQWFDSVDALLNRRDELLLVVYEEFCSLAEAVLKTTLESGRNALGSDTQLALRDLATSWCRARTDLAHRWLGDFLEQRGLAAGGLIEHARLVEDLRARPRSNRVVVTWKLPADGCDEVRVVRAPDPPTGEEAEVYQGRACRFVDTSIEPRTHYVYRVYSVLAGRTGLLSATASTRHEHAGGGSLRLQLAGVLVITVGLGVLGWDRISAWLPLGGGAAAAVLTEEPSAGGGTGEGSQQVQVNPRQSGAGEMGAPTRGNTRRLPPAEDPVAKALAVASEEAAARGLESEVTASSEASASDGGEHAEDDPAPASEPAPPRVEGPPLEVQVVQPPRSYSVVGTTLRLELHGNRPLADRLVAAQLSGLRLERFDAEASPPVLIFDVLPLPLDEESAFARWSFRLADAAGVLSEPITGQRLILHR